MKDPLGLFTNCNCPDTAFKLLPVNCSVLYAYDPCTDACNQANHLTQGPTQYDPHKDELLSEVTVSVLGVDVDQVAVFTKISR